MNNCGRKTISYQKPTTHLTLRGYFTNDSVQSDQSCANETLCEKKSSIKEPKLSPDRNATMHDQLMKCQGFDAKNNLDDSGEAVVTQKTRYFQHADSVQANEPLKLFATSGTKPRQSRHRILRRSTSRSLSPTPSSSMVRSKTTVDLIVTDTDCSTDTVENQKSMMRSVCDLLPPGQRHSLSPISASGSSLAPCPLGTLASRPTAAFSTFIDTDSGGQIAQLPSARLSFGHPPLSGARAPPPTAPNTLLNEWSTGRTQAEAADGAEKFTTIAAGSCQLCPRNLFRVRSGSQLACANPKRRGSAASQSSRERQDGAVDREVEMLTMTVAAAAGGSVTETEDGELRPPPPPRQPARAIRRAVSRSLSPTSLDGSAWSSSRPTLPPSPPQSLLSVAADTPRRMWGARAPPAARPLPPTSLQRLRRPSELSEAVQVREDGLGDCSASKPNLRGTEAVRRRPLSSEATAASTPAAMNGTLRQLPSGEDGHFRPPASSLTLPTPLRRRASVAKPPLLPGSCDNKPLLPLAPTPSPTPPPPKQQ